MSLQREHSESGVAALVQIIRENALEVRKPFKGTQCHKPVDSICEIRAEWSPVNTVQSLRWIGHINGSSEAKDHN